MLLQIFIISKFIARIFIKKILCIFIPSFLLTYFLFKHYLICNLFSNIMVTYIIFSKIIKYIYCTHNYSENTSIKLIKKYSNDLI
jgi:hypothetical protein